MTCGIATGLLGTGTASVLQWGRDHVTAEIAALLSYSVFKDLRARLRAPHNSTSKYTFQTRRLTHIASDGKPLVCPRAPLPRLSTPGPTARVYHRVVKTG